MAEEGGLAKLLGGETAEEETAADIPAAALDAGAAAMAMEAARSNAALAEAAAAYFQRQTRLVTIQTEHMHEQREVLLSQLRLKRLSERMRIGTQFFFAIAATCIALYLLLMLHDAI